MTDAFSVTEDVKAVPETNAAVPANRVYTPVPRELREFFARVKTAVRNSKALRFRKLTARDKH